MAVAVAIAVAITVHGIAVAAMTREREIASGIGGSCSCRKAHTSVGHGRIRCHLAHVLGGGAADNVEGGHAAAVSLGPDGHHGLLQEVGVAVAAPRKAEGVLGKIRVLVRACVVGVGVVVIVSPFLR